MIPGYDPDIIRTRGMAQAQEVENQEARIKKVKRREAKKLEDAKYIKAFIESSCNINPAGWIPLFFLYSAYLEYHTGIQSASIRRPEGIKVFGRQLTRLNFIKKKGRRGPFSGVFIEGITLK